MISAKRAAKLASQNGVTLSEPFTTIRAVSDHIKSLSKNGLSNTSVVVSEKKSQSIVKTLTDKGFRVYGSSRPDGVMLDIEWWFWG